MTDAELERQLARCVELGEYDEWVCADHGNFIELRRIEPHAIYQKYRHDVAWRLIEGQG